MKTEYTQWDCRPASAVELPLLQRILDHAGVDGWSSVRDLRIPDPVLRRLADGKLVLLSGDVAAVSQGGRRELAKAAAESTAVNSTKGEPRRRVVIHDEQLNRPTAGPRTQAIKLKGQKP